MAEVMSKINGITLGIYEKALPENVSWSERLALAAEAGFDFVEMSLDPSVCVCTTMFRITPTHLLWALENLAAGNVVNRISVGERTRHHARVALDRMLSLR